MWEKGEKVLVYGGKHTSDGFKTRVSIAEIIEIGEVQLLVRLKAYSYYGKGKIAIIDKTLCRPIEKSIDIGSLYCKKVIPNVGDLIKYFQTDWESNFKTMEIGTVQSILYQGSEINIEIMVDGKIKKVDLEDCLLLQKAGKIPEKV
jgi:hypothetical protein